MLTGLQNIIGLGLIPMRDAEGTGGGGGDGSGGDGDDSDGGGDDVQKRIDEAVAAAVEGLKKTNADLKTEKTEAKKTADELAAKLAKLGGDEGIEALVKMRQSLENDETGKLLAEGKHEEWFERRAAAMKTDYERKLEAAAAALTGRDEALKGANAKLHSTLLDVGINEACQKAEVTEPGARQHAKLLAEREFQFDPEISGHVLKDADGGIVYGKDGKNPKTIQEWIEEKREVPEFRLWWGPSKSAGLTGANLPGDPNRKNEVIGKMSMAEFRTFRAKQQESAA